MECKSRVSLFLSPSQGSISSQQSALLLGKVKCSSRQGSWAVSQQPGILIVNVKHKQSSPSTHKHQEGERKLWDFIYFTPKPCYLVTTSYATATCYLQRTQPWLNSLNAEDATGKCCYVRISNYVSELCQYC